MLDRIESSVQRIRQFTANASHDLRTPLSLIRTHAEIALRRTRSEIEYRESLARILSVSEETTGLVESLLTLARADAEASHLHFAEMDLTGALQKTASQFAIQAGSKGLAFTSQLGDTPLLVKGDSAALDSLLHAVLENALKYTPSGGFVRLRAAQNMGNAVTEIEDTGIGIAAGDLSHIFDRFFRADQARSREVPGAGLGLSIARWIAETHNGRIEVESQLGAGSVFRIVLPLSTTTTTARTNAVAQPLDSEATLS